MGIRVSQVCAYLLTLVPYLLKRSCMWFGAVGVGGEVKYAHTCIPGKEGGESMRILAYLEKP